MARKNDLMVWWIPQVPSNDPFCVMVDSIDEARVILDVLAQYDLYQFNHKIKPDYSNTGGLVEFDGEEWADWYDENDDDIDNADFGFTTVFPNGYDELYKKG